MNWSNQYSKLNSPEMVSQLSCPAPIHSSAIQALNFHLYEALALARWKKTYGVFNLSEESIQGLFVYLFVYGIVCLFNFLPDYLLTCSSCCLNRVYWFSWLICTEGWGASLVSYIQKYTITLCHPLCPLIPHPQLLYFLLLPLLPLLFSSSSSPPSPPPPPPSCPLPFPPFIVWSMTPFITSGSSSCGCTQVMSDITLHNILVIAMVTVIHKLSGESVPNGLKEVCQ